MAIINFTVPDDVKLAFDNAFADRNKNSIMVELMRRAVRQATHFQRREQLFNQLSEARAQRPTVSIEAIRNARLTDRP